MRADPTLREDPDAGDRWLAAGPWTLSEAPVLEHHVGALAGKHAGELDARGIDRLDSAGALALLKAAERLAIAPERVHLDSRHTELFNTVAAARREAEPEHVPPEPFWRAVPTHIGEAVATIAAAQVQLVGFLGLTLVTAARTLTRAKDLKLTSVVHHMEQSGVNALPLVALLSFLVGAVVAFLGATVLREFGAELFVVDLTVYAFLREFGVFLTAILLAGRTASAFTAQIGTMKSREEIDAIRTLGLDPIVLLVLPRVLALLFMLPILAVLATLSGIAGGMMVCALTLDISPELFVVRAWETVALQHYLVGVLKAPIFAVVIALVGCLEGLKVAGTAQSVGERTTAAVVQSISLVIVINALAAMFFMEINW